MARGDDSELRPHLGLWHWQRAGSRCSRGLVSWSDALRKLAAGTHASRRGYAGMPFPFDEMHPPSFRMTRSWTLQQLAATSARGRPCRKTRRPTRVVQWGDLSHRWSYRGAISLQLLKLRGVCSFRLDNSEPKSTRVSDAECTTLLHSARRYSSKRSVIITGYTGHVG